MGQHCDPEEPSTPTVVHPQQCPGCWREEAQEFSAHYITHCRVKCERQIHNITPNRDFAQESVKRARRHHTKEGHARAVKRMEEELDVAKRILVAMRLAGVIR